MEYIIQKMLFIKLYVYTINTIFHLFLIIYTKLKKLTNTFCVTKLKLNVVSYCIKNTVKIFIIFTLITIKYVRY